jgi:beta-glucosidase
MSKKDFPKGFIWGVATASYQIEGSPLADGAGPSIWHRFSHTPANIKKGDTGDVACDHYHRYKEDVALMKALGVKAYRFSIAWPRIFPRGYGKINLKGVDFYDRLIDELLKANITPFITLYHWDLPSALQDKGGWTNRDISEWFGDYADFIFQRFGDRVKNWITLNEPWVTAFVGHLFGTHAPGVKDIYAAFEVVHNQLRAHSKAVEAFREEEMGGKIGITLSNHSEKPASDKTEDVMAAKVAHEFVNYPLFLNPIFNGDYPEHLLSAAKEYFPRDYESDLNDIKKPIDFVGINYYSGNLMKFDAESPLGIKNVDRGLEKSEMGWEIYPQGLYDILKGVQDTYDPKEVFITENGVAFKDEVEKEEVHDEKRIDYLKRHCEQAHRAIEDGVKLKGYFVWSLMDNFEWAEGYSKRFGIVYVDYATQKRIIKDSAKWYSNVIANNSIEI